MDQALFNTGQACLQWSRLLVPRGSTDEAAELAGPVAAGYRVGDPRDPGTDLGPLVSAEALALVTGHIQRGIDDGAELVTGGPGRPAGTERGYFVTPTVFAGVDPGMALAREEIFGPVVSIIGYGTEDEAVSIANNTVYGLHGSVWSGSDDHAQAVARRSAPVSSTSMAARSTWRRRSAGSSNPASAASAAWRDWTASSRSSPCSSPRTTVQRLPAPGSAKPA